MLPKNFMPWDEYVKTLGKKCCGVGAIIRNNNGEILLEKLSYKDYWSLPGGSVDDGESPKVTLVRELKEELSLEITVGELIYLRYLPVNGNKPESLQFLFDGGKLADEQINAIKVDGEEVLEFKFVKIEEMEKYVAISKRVEIIKEAVRNIDNNGFSYIEE
jgi:8-oxo-dGTP pyrophosphatase MutT (NUDIX family)